ncbi:glycosyltransferase [Vibrio rotiferianus]|uniref:glycosyltransferase n=1 Tax=Vibrio rotiferianus TaxID=190895 RepID=UPI002895CEBC|nr:Glycosyl transferase family 1 [Vibrio rotiferianus]
MKKILHIGKYYPPFFGGIENFMSELVAAQSMRHKVNALVHNHERSFFTKIESDNDVEVSRVGLWGVFAFVPLSPLFWRDLKAQLANEPDVIHIHMPNVSAFWLLLSRRAQRIPWVIHWHADVLGSEPTKIIQFLYPFYRLFESALLRRASAVICTSPNYLSSSKPLRKYREKCYSIPLGLSDISDSIEEKNCVERKLTKEVTALKVLVVGRLSYYKGHSILLEALKKSEGLGTEIEVHIIGDGECAPAVQQQILDLNLSNVSQLGKVSDEKLEQAFEWCDLICLPSIERTEAFGLVILEAARKGKPALVTDVPGSGMSWVVQDCESGWVVKHKNASALSEKLVQIYEDRAEVELFGQRARQRYLDCFSIESIAHQVDVVYQHLSH